MNDPNPVQIKKPTSRLSFVVGVLFSLPFAAVGVFMAYLIGSTLWQVHGIAAWPEMPATIQSIVLNHSGKDSSETKATYNYIVAGHSYTGHRVSVHRGGDNIGSFQQRVYGELQQYKRTGEPFHCYVNPQNPDDAVLYRQPRWEMIAFYGVFMLVFCGIGFGLLIAMIVGGRREQKQKTAQAAQPQEPWLWNQDWAGGVICASNRAAMWFFLGVAVLWNAISGPAAFGALHDYSRQHDPAVFVALIFPVIGIGLAFWAARLVWLQIRYGTSCFRMSRVPGVIGGELRGIVEIPAHIQPVDGFRATLRCVHRITIGSGKERSTSESVLWEDVRLQAHEMQDGNPTHSLLPILFVAPRNCRPTEMSQPDNQIVWRLEVTAATDRGPRYNSRFEVPMFVTPDSVANVQPETGAADRYGHSLRSEDALRDCGVRTETLPGGMRYTFPAARNKGIAVFTTIFFAIWTGMIYIMLRQHVPLMFSIIFCLADIGVIIAVLTCWFDWRCVEITPEEARVSGGIFGLAGLRCFKRGEIVAVEATAGASQGDRQYFSLKLRTSGGATHTAGKGIEGRVAAEVLAASLRRLLNLPEATPDDA